MCRESGRWDREGGRLSRESVVGGKRNRAEQSRAGREREMGGRERRGEREKGEEDRTEKGWIGCRTEAESECCRTKT